MMMIFRPKDHLWEGYPEDAPRVGTSVCDVVHNRIDSVLRNQEYISNEALRTLVKISKIVSSQTYNDTIRTVNDFFDYYDPSCAQTVLRYHLVPLMTTGNIRLPFLGKDFLVDCGSPTHLEKFLCKLTPY
jgi:hypothetical protein